MDSVRNPFAPGAGSRPPELAGRDAIIEEATVAIQRALLGKSVRSQMLLGLRGVGKTVLLNKIEDIAQQAGHVTTSAEVREKQRLSDLLAPRLSQVLRRLSLVESARRQAHAALRALRSFVSVFKLSYGEVNVSVDAEAGVADSGDLESDLTDLFLRIGEAAQAADKAWTLLIDEIQYLCEDDFAALIVALHKINQKELPVVFFGAGLPQVAGLSGDAKSYAERLFLYSAVGALDSEDAKRAIRQPVEAEGEVITDAAIDEIIRQTRGYPYYLQEWGYQCWERADEGQPIEAAHAARATIEAIRRLDEGFFNVRFERLTPKEREYVLAMARLGAGPYRSSDVADALGETHQSLGPRRAQIINKGMIYSPGHGDIAFTVPMFDEFLMRKYPPAQ